jgi:hypothetical protein
VTGSDVVLPSVVLLVNETGEDVLRQLGSMADLVGRPGPATAVLHVDAAAMSRLAWPREAAVEWPAPSLPLEEALRDVVRSLLDWRGLERLERQGNAIAEGVQVLVVADAGDALLEEVLASARDEAGRVARRVDVAALLDASPGIGGANGRQAFSGRSADLTLLFADRPDLPSASSAGADRMRRYSLAQAVLALTSAGLSVPGLRDAGSGADLRLCMVVFPRAAAGRYCAARLGREVVEKWRRKLDAAVDPGISEVERGLAERAMREIREWLEDTAVRPGTDPERTHGAARHLWPSLAILRAGTASGDAGRRAHQQLLEATDRLFGLFAHADVDREARDRPTHDWADVAHERGSRATEVLHTWQRTARATWSLLPDLLLDRLRAAVNRCWASGDHRVALPRSLADECDRQLTHLVVANAGLRERHAQRYRDRCAAYRRRAGRWWRELDEPALGDRGEASPAWGFPAEGDVADRDRSPRPEQSEVEPMGHHLTPGEDRIAGALRDRVRDLHALVPSWTSAITVALLLLTAILAPSLALLADRRLTALAVAGSLAAAVLAHLALRRWRWWNARRAEADLLDFLAVCFAYRCERLEDRLRVGALGPVRWYVQHTLHLLEETDAFLDAVGEQMERVAADTERGLFEAPTGEFDVLAVGGRWLVRPASGGPVGPSEITLEQVLGQVRWRLHPTFDTETLATALLSATGMPALLETAEDEIGDRVLAAVRPAVLDVMPADVSEDLERALAEPAVRRHLQRRMGTAWPYDAVSPRPGSDWRLLASLDGAPLGRPQAEPDAMGSA